MAENLYFWDLALFTSYFILSLVSKSIYLLVLGPEGGAGSEKGGELLEGYAEYLRITAPAMHKQSSPRPRNIIMRACPECGVEMRSDSITKHCKIRHKVSYRYCSACARCVQKKVFI